MPAQLAAFGIVVYDMARALAFYRELGIDLPPEADEQPHADAALPGGLRLMFDTADTIRSITAPGDAPATVRRPTTSACDWPRAISSRACAVRSSCSSSRRSRRRWSIPASKKQIVPRPWALAR